MTNRQKENDKIVRDHHKDEEFKRAIRRQREPKLPIGDGHIVTGSIFDCNRSYFERLLNNYWDRLFLGWNPYKRNGQGCWEVWQRPINKKELNDMEHWVADLEYLSPAFVDRLRAMDQWTYKKDVGRNLDEDYDRAALDWEIAQDKREDELIKYAVKENKKYFGKLKGLTQDGYNPFWFLSDRKQGSGQI